jgi:hypothetical protein
MAAWPGTAGTGDGLGLPAREHPAVPVLPGVRRVIDDLDRAMEDAVKEALERDRAHQEELRRQRDADADASDSSDAVDASETSSDERDDTAGDAACPGGEATNPDR